MAFIREEHDISVSYVTIRSIFVKAIKWRAPFLPINIYHALDWNFNIILAVLL